MGTESIVKRRELGYLKGYEKTGCGGDRTRESRCKSGETYANSAPVSLRIRLVGAERVELIIWPCDQQAALSIKLRPASLPFLALTLL